MVAEGIKLMFLGMGVVFVFLLLVYAVISLFSNLLRSYSCAEIIAARESQQSVNKKSSPNVCTSDGQLIAVISAAVSKYRDTN